MITMMMKHNEVMSNNSSSFPSSNKKTDEPNQHHHHHKNIASLDQAAHHKTVMWWQSLCGIAIINILMWFWTYSNFQQHREGDDEASDDDDQGEHFHITYYRLRRVAHLILSGIYTFVCAYRSILPRIDLERYCLFDTKLSSIVLGRSAATIAEISFAIQIAFVVYEWSTVYNHKMAANFSYIIPPTLTLAQCFCWMGVVTKNHIYHAVEESLWAIIFSGIFIVTSTFVYYNNYGLDEENEDSVDHHYNEIKYIATLGSIVSAIYVTFMILVDVPMYIERWKIHTSRGIYETNLLNGFIDALDRRVVTKDWSVWKHEVAWLTGYFSFAVWASIAMNYYYPTN